MILFLSISLIVPHMSVGAPAKPVPQANQQFPTLVFLTPSNISDLSKTIGSSVTFGVNVTRSPPFNAFLVSLRYQSIQNVASSLGVSSSGIDPTGNVLGPVEGSPNCPSNAPDTCPKIFLLCIDGRVVLGTQCVPNVDQPGVITYGLYLLGNRTSAQNTQGRLFQVTFNVVGTGFVELQLFDVVLANGASALSGGNGTKIDVGTQDAFFANRDCPLGTGTLCKPMITSFNVSPTTPSLGHTAYFTATVNDLNRNAVVVKYTWSWGDATPYTDQTHASTPRIGQPEQHAFSQSGSYFVTMYVLDNETVSWGVTQIVNVVNVFIDLAVVGLTADPQFNVFPGTIVHVGASVYNNSTLAETGDLTITLEGKSLGPNAFGSFKLDGRGGNGPNTGTLSSLSLDTTGLSPRVYRIEATVAPVKGANITSNNVAYAYIQLISPRPSGLFSLTLLQTTTFGIVIVVGAAFAVTRLFKRPSYESEPL